MNQEQVRSIDVLNRCLNLRIGDDCDDRLPGRQQRLGELIAKFVPHRSLALECVAGWHFCVPGAFRTALDIVQTPRIVEGISEMRWTQGSWFHFREGDTIYDSVNANQAWNPKNVQVCLDIRKAAPAKPAGANGDPRVEGTVILDVLTPNESGSRLEKRKQVAVTQDEFVRILILGPPREWNFFPTTAAAPPSGVVQGKLPF